MKTLTLIVLIFLGVDASAQFNTSVKMAFSAGLDLGIPQNSIYSIGTAASGKFEIPASTNICITITGGYSYFFYKSNLFQSSLTPSPAGFVPLKAGAKYYFNQGVYVEGEAGTVVETNYLKRNLFAFSLGPGFTIPVNDKHGVDIGLRYESWSDHQLRQTAIRFAYRFGL